MRRIGLMVVLGLVISLVVGAQPPVDRSTLKQLILTVEELQAVLGKDWRLGAPPEPLRREPEGAITMRVFFQYAPTPNLVLVVILYWFEVLEEAKKFYREPIVFDFAGQSAEKPLGYDELLKKELKVGTEEGADEARLIKDPIERNPVLQFRKGQFVARFRPALLDRGSTLDFPGEGLIKVAKKQLEKILAFLKKS